MSLPSEQIAAIIAAHRDIPGALLPILHAIQDELRYIPPDAIEPIASALNLSRAEVYGVITFYHYFLTSPPAPHQIHICCAEACQNMGSDKLMQHAKATSDYSVHPVYCLGLCANSPAMMIDETLHARVTPEKFDRLTEKLGSQS
jgi:formate dehydrogenase subunit gamma